MDTQLFLIPAVAIGRAIFGWLENALADGTIDLPEWSKLLETVVRMGVPMVALVFGMNVSPEMAAGIVTLGDFALSKFYSALKKKK